MRTGVPLTVLVALIAAPAAGSASDAAALLKVLSYNVHGQAPIPALGSNPKKRMPRIAGKLSDFDLVLLQEDFAYHEILEGGVSGFAHRGNGWRWRWGYLPTFPLWGLCWATFACGNPPLQGSGLSTMATADALEGELLAAQPFRRCADYLFGGNDCFAAKGFLAVRVALSDDLSIDVYNTHLESGPGPTAFVRPNADRDVRRSQLEELILYAAEASAGRAMIVAGDLNSKRCCEKDHEPVRVLMHSLDLRDSGAREILPSDNWEGLDYILYRSAPGTCLKVVDAGEATDFVYAKGEKLEPLSDHPALYATFSVGEADDCAP